MNFLIDPFDDSDLTELFFLLAQEDISPRREFAQSLKHSMRQELQVQHSSQRTRFWGFLRGMKKNRRIVAPALGFAAMVAVLFVIVLFGGSRLYDWNQGGNVAYLTVQKGDVRVYRSQHIFGDIDLSRRLNAREDQPVTLHEGDLVSSGRGAVAEIVFPDQSHVMVGEDTHLKISELQARDASTPLSIVMHLDRGIVRSQVAHLRPGVDRFEIIAPNLSAHVKGTIFRMDVNSRGTRVATEEGVVRVIWDGKKVDVAAGRELQLLLTGATAHYDLRPQSPLLYADVAASRSLDDDDATIHTNAERITWEVQAIPDSIVFFYVNDELAHQIDIGDSGRGVVSFTPGKEGRYVVWAVTQLSTGERSLPSPKEIFVIDRTPPALVILQPTEPQVVSSDVLLEGRTEPDAAVSLNGQTLQVDGEGHFEIMLSLEPGANTLELAAIDRAGNEVHLTSVIIYEKLQ